MRRIDYSIRFFISLLILFILHRMFSFSVLYSGYDNQTLSFIQAWAVGLMSDFWIAAIALAIFFITAWFIKYKYLRLFSGLFFVILTILISFHQNYVEFYHFQIIPYHLTYVFDRDFIVSNGFTLTDKSWSIMFCGFVLAYFIIRKGNAKKDRVALNYAILFLILTVSVGIHALNIHYKVQWFVPEKLQLNMFERLYANALITKIPPPLTAEEMDKLNTAFPTAKEPTSDTFAFQIKQRFQKAIADKMRPLFIVVLMESMRPSEIGFYGESNNPKTSLTPNLDLLSATGLSFVNAFSTGNVTRGAQEAVFCSYLGSQNTSMMRNRPDVKIKCIPDYIAERRSTQGAPKGFSFWYHGGEARFDSQLAFWQSHQVDDFITKQSFPKDAPSTGWGVGDHTFLRKSLTSLLELQNRPDFAYGFGSILTVSNHIPWEIPSDRPPYLPSDSIKDGHPSYGTTAYVDFAIGEFIEGLKKNYLWDQSLVILVSDHGTVLPQRHKVKDHDNSPWDQQTHIGLLLTGGIAESVFASGPRSNIEYVSQADLGSLAAYVLDIQTKDFYGETLLGNTRITPITCDLGAEIYVPKLKTVFTASDLVTTPSSALTEEQRLSLLYYRRFLRQLETR